ncbi:MAG: portal protein [Pseudomonadota bacterium]|uniref:Putative head tail connector protein n=1 Tax=viral metagenome TaxID=1070528 RepID=A0A6M3KZS6_9ZZZZ
MVTQDQKLKTLVTSRQSKLETDKTNFNDRMQEVADFVSPHRDDIRGNRKVGGEKKGTKIFDGTAVSAAVLATDGIHGYHVSPAFAWFKYEMNRKQVNTMPEVREWLDEIEFNMYMALNRSNFYNEMWSFIYDGFTLGTAAMIAEEDIAKGRIFFEAVHPGEIYIAENQHGEVDVLHRKRMLTAKQMVEKFGRDNCPIMVGQAYDTNPFTMFEVIHAVFPREEYDTRKRDGKNKPFASVWLMTQGNHICKEDGFKTFPYHVWRYLKTGKEPYGVSPAILAMADIKGLNLMAKTLLGAAQLAVDPAYNVPSYLSGKVQLKPRGLNYINPGTTDKISAINTGANFPIGIDREQAKQKSIRERFHVDTFLMLASLEGRGQRTAYEVSELMAEKAAVLGAELGSFNASLGNILESVYEIENQSSNPRMPPPPDALLEMAGSDPSLRFDPVYMGPLAQAQRERFSKDGVRKFMLELRPLIDLQMAAAGSSEVLDNFDLDEAGRILADSNRVPAAVIRPETTVAKIRAGRAMAQQQASQQQDAQAILQVLKTASEADKNSGGKLSEALQGAMPPGGVRSRALPSKEV